MEGSVNIFMVPWKTPQRFEEKSFRRIVQTTI